ncbi:tetratricopeptide repeat protein [Sphingobium cupriresistens]|uniref:Cytochrome C biosynthesis protein n=2 Tax=Sphingobium cupriresistens TaxID=1132417 RepID=A0A0J7Y255_9SPHN|nr:cytochrome C biosynthesis protein [Sphingobium cupriresistens]KMS57807.1 cytochrome C biosynthesis protein [Sphingobium cupriresistens LL01]RYM11275.1 cytochrome C biosynthesis protein [Sphingobium cupriresistens]
MTGWFIAFGLAAAGFIALLLIGRIPRSAREISAAALLLGLAGYAWQGNPGLAGAPRASRESAGDKFDEKLAEQRRGMAERYGPAGQWLMLSDGLGRQGKTREAANILLSGLRATPDDPNLWLGLGNALVAHADGVVSPGADFAYRRALTLDPEGPAPRYFYGLALARNGQLQPARDLWAPLAASAPPGSKVRAELEANIARIDSMLDAGGPAAP